MPKVNFDAMPAIARGGLAYGLTQRGELFGRPYAALTQAVMRGPSEWSIGTRELFAAFVSRQNQCSF